MRRTNIYTQDKAVAYVTERMSAPKRHHRTNQRKIDICLNCEAKTCRGDCPKVHSRRGADGKENKKGN